MRNFDRISNHVFRLREDRLHGTTRRLEDGRWLWEDGSIWPFPPVSGGDIIEGARIAGNIRRHPNSQLFVVEAGDGALQTAIDACVDDNGDVILVLPGDHDLTTMLDVNKDGILIMAAELGLPAEEQGEKFTVNAAASLDTGPVATITDPCRIVGLGFAGRDTTAESLLVDCEEAGGYHGGFIELDHCRFSCWYGAMTYGLRFIGGAVNKVRSCSFDGLFGGFGTGAIGFDNDAGGLTPAYVEVLDSRFQGVGSSKHAIVHKTGSTPFGFLYAHNYLLPGFLGNYGAFLDNNNVASKGLIADNWVAPAANQSAAFENLTNSTIGFADNHYEET